MLIDIHTHTYPTSDDSNLTPQDLISEAKKVGLDGICITDHDGFWNPREIEKIGIDNDFLVLPGCEVTTEEGHLLVYGLDKYIFGMHKSAFVKELVAESQGAIVVAHPYRRVYRASDSLSTQAYKDLLKKTSAEPVFENISAVEVRNGRGSSKENAFSQRLALELDLPGTGASDAHQISDVGTFATLFEDKISDLKDFIAALTTGKYRAADLRLEHK